MCVDLTHDLSLQIIECLTTTFLLLWRHVVGEAAGSQRLRTRGVTSDVDLVEPQFGQQVVGALELGLRLAWEADDDVGGNRNAWDAPTDAGNQTPVVVGGLTAPHTDQHLIVASLHRHLDVLAHLWQFRHGIEQLVRHPVGM